MSGEVVQGERVAPAGAARVEMGLLLVIALVWLPTWARCSVEWTLNAQYYFGWAVPFLAAYLAFERLGGALPAPGAHRVLGIIWTVAFALPQPLFRVVSEANSDWRLMLWGLAVSALGVSFGLLYLAGGWGALRRFAFPLAFLLTAVPWPTAVENGLVQGLMRFNAIISAEFVSLCGVPAIASGNVIELPTGVLGVNEACSGIRSLQSTLMASIFLGGLYRLTWLSRTVLVAGGVAIAFLFNVARTVFLSWQGAFHGIEATEKWHDSAGFAILAAVLVCLWIMSRFFERRALAAAARSAAMPSPAAPAPPTPK